MSIILFPPTTRSTWCRSAQVCLSHTLPLLFSFVAFLCLAGSTQFSFNQRPSARPDDPRKVSCLPVGIPLYDPFLASPPDRSGPPPPPRAIGPWPSSLPPFFLYNSSALKANSPFLLPFFTSSTITWNADPPPPCCRRLRKSIVSQCSPPALHSGSSPYAAESDLGNSCKTTLPFQYSSITLHDLGSSPLRIFLNLSPPLKFFPRFLFLAAPPALFSLPGPGKPLTPVCPFAPFLFQVESRALSLPIFFCLFLRPSTASRCRYWAEVLKQRS